MPLPQDIEPTRAALAETLRQIDSHQIEATGVQAAFIAGAVAALDGLDSAAAKPEQTDLHANGSLTAQGMSPKNKGSLRAE